MSIPKEPRALMIQLMYLVLTAMLALNITKEVLDAFSTINTSIETSNKGIKEKNDITYKAFDKIADRNPDLKPKRDLLFPKATQIREESAKMVQYLEDWKQDIIKNAGGWITENGIKKIKTMDDIDIPTRMFIEEGNKGDEVKQKLEAFTNKIMEIGGGTNASSLKERLPIQFPPMPKTDDNPKGDWTYGTFHNIPVIAAVTLFSKWQSDVRNSEALMIEGLMAQVGEEEYDPTIFKLDGLMPVATPNISYALDGDEITATIVMAAYSTEANPTISSNRGAVPVKDGVGTLKFRASGTGTQTVKGTITVPTKGSKVETRPWEFSYTVGSEGASLQLDKMNVMYVGVDNPVTISASGYNLGDVSWTMEGADIKQTAPGKYNVRMSKSNYQGVQYVVKAKTKAGTMKDVAKGVIKVKNLPPPTVKFGSIKGSGLMGTGEVRAQVGLAAILEYVDFELPHRVTGYNLLLARKGNDDLTIARGTNPYFDKNPGVKQILNSVRPGDRLIFENIKVKPDGLPERQADNGLIITVK